MSQFEYWVAFLSILLALAVADLMAGLGRIIRERDTVNVYWVPIAWMVLMILALMQGWWTMWELRTSLLEDFVDFFLMALPRLLTVLVAFLLSPPIVTGVRFDLHAHYFKQIRWVAWLFVASLMAISAIRVSAEVDELWSLINAIRLAVLGAIFSLGFVRHPRFHEFVVLAVAFLFSISILID